MTKETDVKIQKAQVDYEQDMIEIEKAEQERKQYTSSSKKTQDKIRRKRIITGAVFCLLALIGTLSIISGVIKTGIKILDNSGEKQEYNTLLTTLVMYDPLPFETPDAADQRVLLASSVWAAIMNEDMTVYETNEFGETLLPAVDVDKYFTKVFGSQISLAHGTFTDSDVEFIYNAEKRAYVIPATNFPTGFAPQVEKIKSSLSEKTVTVGYLSPQTSWADTSERTVSKYVDYIFEKQDGQFALVAIRESEMKVELPLISPEPDTAQATN
ncbi:MAG: hypothetical protein IKU54_00860 [Oscillospiraceae bacterium]|nr:hypothetical protein [Oscillospiraceae bacterium]